MAQRIAGVTENTGLVTIILIWISTSMDWLNDNHLAVISIVTILTGIVTIFAAVYRHKLRKREVDLYQEEVRHKTRRKEDKS